MKKNYKSILHKFFKITIILKGIDGLLDIITSAILFFAKSHTIGNTIPVLIRKELLEDPQDIIANYLLSISQNTLPDTQFFIVIYLLIHGLIKIALSLALNSNNFLAYKISELVLICFVGYQFYRFSHTHSSMLLIFTLMDIIILFLIHFESKSLIITKKKQLK